MNVVVAVLAAAERGTRGLAGGQRRVEGAEVGAQDFGAAQDGVEVRPDHAVALRPLAEPPVAPDDRVVAVQQDDAVGHAFENVFVLQQPCRAPGPPEDTPTRRRRPQIVRAKDGPTPAKGCRPPPHHGIQRRERAIVPRFRGSRKPGGFWTLLSIEDTPAMSRCPNTMPCRLPRPLLIIRGLPPSNNRCSRGTLPLISDRFNATRPIDRGLRETRRFLDRCILPTPQPRHHSYVRKPEPLHSQRKSSDKRPACARRQRHFSFPKTQSSGTVTTLHARQQRPRIRCFPTLDARPLPAAPRRSA